MMRYALMLTGLLLTGVATSQCLLTDFEGYTVGDNGVVMFRQPSFSGSTAAFLAYTGLCSNGPNCSIISDEQNHTANGSLSLKVVWQFTGAASNAWLRLTTFNTLNLPNPTINFSHKVAVWLYVPSGTPDFYLTLGVRETGSTADCGLNGGTTSGIEWIGATSGYPPIGKLVDQKDQWVRVVFDIPNEPIVGFAGTTANGRLDTQTGTLEHLAFTPVDPSLTDIYTVYLDDIETFVGIPGDVDGSGCVDDADLLAVLFAFGCSSGCGAEDVNGDGTVDDADLLIVLFNFGQGC
ncbi:hypothetical protein HRbin15_00153 [bacterium HR15]|nr:hypothetical protein HRbin15_00153 [bacterium HR15]